MRATLSPDIEILRAAIAALPPPAPGSRRTYPAAIRKAAFRLLDQGTSFKSLSRGTGLRVDVLKRWEHAARTRQTAKVQPAPRVFAIEDAIPATVAPTTATADMTQPRSMAPLRLQLGAFIVTVALADGGL
jgi:hypothetical protein